MSHARPHDQKRSLLGWVKLNNKEEAVATMEQTPMADMPRALASTDDIGRTALHHAAIRGNFALCKLLIDCGADVNAKDSAGLSALHLTGEASVARLLLARGSAIDAKSKAGLSPIEYSQRVGRPTAYIHILQGGPPVRSIVLAVAACLLAALAVALYASTSTFFRDSGSL